MIRIIMDLKLIPKEFQKNLSLMKIVFCLWKQIASQVEKISLI